MAGAGLGDGLFGPLAGELVGPLVLRVARMALDSMHVVITGGRVDTGPQVGLLDPLLGPGQPAVALPADRHSVIP